MENRQVPEKLNRKYDFDRSTVDEFQKASKADTFCLQPTFICSDGSTIYRPLTALEVMQEVVIDFNTLHDEYEGERSIDDRERLLQQWYNTCTGVLNKGGSTKFKLISESEHLITINPGFDIRFLSVKYNSVDAAKLDTEKGKYNIRLCESDVPEQPAWRALAGETKDGLYVLKEFSGIVFARLKQRFNEDKGMGFYMRRIAAQEDELRVLFVINFDYDSFAMGSSVLTNYASFLRVAQLEDPQVRKNRLLEEEVDEILSQFDQFKSLATQQQHDTVKQNALQNLKGIYNG